jgi:hypothetical protein
VTKTNIAPRHLSGCLGGAKSRPPVGTSVEDSTAGRVNLFHTDLRSRATRPLVGQVLAFRPVVEKPALLPANGGQLLIKLVILKHSFTGREMTSTRPPVVRDKNFTFLLERLTHLSSQSIAIIPS